MLNQPTIEKLYKLRLSTMADVWSEQEKQAGSLKLDFDERFGMLVDAEFLARENRRLARLLKHADLRITDACIEDVASGAGRGLDKSTLRRNRSAPHLSS